MNPPRFAVAAFALAVGCFQLTSHSLLAQVTASGTVTGTVANESTGQFLRNAEVRIEGTNLFTLTESDGSFRLSNVPAGPQKLNVTYAGLDVQSRVVNVAAGQTARETFGLKSDIYQLATLTVAGDREGQAKAINDQKNADHMKSVIASDAFGDLIDSNAAELLKSVPGFAMNYAGEDAIGFTMRGQNSQYASITLDGNGISNPGTRALNMRNVQVNNVESIEVNRAPNASQPANSMGGSVNLVSKSAFSQQGRRIRFEVGMNINSALHQFGPSYQGYGKEAYTQYPTAQFSYSNVFRANTEHPIGVTVSLLKGGRYRYNTQYSPSYTFVPAIPAGTDVSASNQSIVSSVNMQEASAGFRQDYYSVNLDYKLAPNTTIFFRTYYQQGPDRHLYGLHHRINPTAANQTSGTGTAQVAINGNTPNHIDSRPNATPVSQATSTGSRILKTTTHEVSENQNYNFNGGGKSRFGELNLEYNAYLGRDFRRNPISGLSKGGTLTYDVLNVGYTMDNIQSESGMTLTQTAGPDYKSIANYGRLTWTGTNNSNIDRKWGAKIDAKRSFNGRIPVTVQAGWLLDGQDRSGARTGKGGRYTFGSGPDGAFATADDVALPLAQFLDTRLPGRWNMHGFPSIQTGEFISIAKLSEYVKANPAAATLDPVTDVTNEYGTIKEFEERIDAGYAMATIRLKKLTLVPGVRWERTTDDGTGYARRTLTTPAGLTLQQQADFVKAQYFPVSRHASYNDLYPNLQARYNFSDRLILRSAFTETIGRPNFANLLPGDTVNDAQKTISRNNPDLEPFTARNYDVTVEYYFGRNTGNVTAALFRKDIENYFQTVSYTLPVDDPEYPAYVVTENQNIPATTKTDGVEFGYQQALRFLPGPFKNLLATASYTYVRSTPPPGARVATGIFPTVYNLGLTYNSRGLRLDLRYNMRKSWLNSINNTTGEKTIFRDNDRFDLALNYRFRKNYTFYFDWRNFMNEEDVRLVGLDQRMNFHQTAGMSINTGFRGEF